MSTAARIDELRKKFEENPRRYFAPLANELRKAGDVTQAIALCREFLPKQPGHMSGFIVFGQSLYEAGELEEARTVFEQALSLDPENLIALRHLGDIARASGDAAGARRWYERVLDADPRNDDIAAQLSTLAALRPQTPATPQAETFESVAARLSETPPVGMDPIAFTVMPTPDSVMRAIDLDGLESRFRDHAPIDLDAVEESAASAPAEASQDAWSDSGAPTLDMPEFEAPEVQASAPDAPAAPDVPELHMAFPGDDPFAFPDGVDQVEAEASAATDATSHDDAEFVEANFEEGLIAENWPDTSELEARVLTPRSLTPVSVTPLSSAALDDAIAAFGREREASPAAFDDRADGLEPVVESVAQDEHVQPLDAFEATSVEFEAAGSHVASGEDVTLEAPVTFDAMTDEREVPAASGDVISDLDATASFEAVTDEMPIPQSFFAADEAPATEDAAAEFAAEDIVASDFLSTEIAASEVVAGDVSAHYAVADDLRADDAVAVDALADDALAGDALAGDALAGDTLAGDTVAPTSERVAAASELPWLAVADSTAEMHEAIEEAEPGLEEIAGVFADDAKSAGDHGAVTVAALEDPLPSGEEESFADVAQAIDEEAAAAIADEFSAFDMEADADVEEQAEAQVEAPADAQVEAQADAHASIEEEHAAIESHVAQVGTPATGSPAFVTETMGELLVAQGFVARAIEVYDELVRRRPFDPVLSARLVELRAMMSPVTEPEDEAAIGAESPAAPDSSFEMFSPVMSDGFDATSPTPPYGTPVSATPVMGVSAFGGHPSQTPAQATPAFTPRVTPSVTPYAQPAVSEDYAPRRSAGEWFAALAARRVPRRTPAQPVQAVESSPEGLASLFGDSGASHDDAAARALADAFAPLSERDLESGSVLDFDFARATPAFSPAVTAPHGAAAITPSHASTPPSFTAAATPPASPASGGNAGFSFDKFFPDPATRRPTPAAPSQNVGNAPVSDDLAQFSAWLKGLGNP